MDSNHNLTARGFIYLNFYNTRRPHSPLDGRTPDQAYFKEPMPEAVSA